MRAHAPIPSPFFLKGPLNTKGTHSILLLLYAGYGVEYVEDLSNKGSGNSGRGTLPVRLDRLFEGASLGMEGWDKGVMRGFTYLGFRV